MQKDWGFMIKFFDTIWVDELNLNNGLVVKKLLKKLNIKPKTFLMESTQSNIKDELKKKTCGAYNRGIFRAPSFIISDEIFWEQDCLDFALKATINN